ncbi:MAG: hypothetical protein ACYDBY_20570 [Thermoanaerobaculia bacterium]
MTAVGVLAFLSVKLVAYAAWCRLGLGFLAPERFESPLRRAGFLAGVRLAIGLLLGWLFLFGLAAVAPAQNRLGVSPLALLAGSALLRWLEWSFVGALAAGGARSPRAVLLGRSAKEHLWRVGGVALSFATDLAGLLGAGALGLVPC